MSDFKMITVCDEWSELEESILEPNLIGLRQYWVTSRRNFNSDPYCSGCRMLD